jgi:hypothetical protein
MKVYIGYDEREHEAARVAVESLRDVTHGQIEPELLCASKLTAHGLLWRLADHRGGQDYDLVSNAKKSTRFAISRFLTPILCQGGMALFVDCDVIFYRDPREMLIEATAKKALSVVQHQQVVDRQRKMVNQEQSVYARKNWSSVMLFNCDHKANRRLTIHDINARPGRDLHALYWLHDDEIGELDPAWNWLVNAQPRPENLGIAHFTLGGPWIDGWARAEHDDMWQMAFAKMLSNL